MHTSALDVAGCSDGSLVDVGVAADMDNAISDLDGLRASVQLYEDRLGLRLVQSEG